MTNNQTTKIDDNELLTVGDVAERLKIARKTVYRYVEEGRLPKAKAGRKFMWTGIMVKNSLVTPARPVQIENLR